MIHSFISILSMLNICRKKVLVSHANSGIDISGEILQCLGPRAWLNDEVIFSVFVLHEFRKIWLEMLYLPLGGCD